MQVTQTKNWVQSACIEWVKKNNRFFEDSKITEGLDPENIIDI